MTQARNIHGPLVSALNATTRRACHSLDILLEAYAREMQTLQQDISIADHKYTLLVKLAVDQLSNRDERTDIGDLWSKTEDFFEHISEETVFRLCKRLRRKRKETEPCTCAACQIDAILGMPFGAVTYLNFEPSLREVIINGTERRVLDQETFDRIHKLTESLYPTSVRSTSDAPTNEAPPSPPGGSSTGGSDPS